MKSIVCSATEVLVITVCLGVVNASGPIAVYALVDKVAFEPNADKPERIRVSGVFITAGERSDVYSAPQRGYLYFALPKANDELALKEWADLKSIAGSRQVVGLGSSWFAKVRVRKSDEEAKSPDDYPTGNGLVKVNPDQPRAKARLDYKERCVEHVGMGRAQKAAQTEPVQIEGTEFSFQFSDRIAKTGISEP